MTSSRNDEKSDVYLYEIPVKTRNSLCSALTKQNVWKELAQHMGYDASVIEEIKCATRQTKESEAEELLSRWGEHNHTITELFVLLRRIRQYQAMNLIKSLVDQRYHKLIPKQQIIDTKNLNGRENTKAISKHLSISEKILNGPPMDLISNENNETDHLKNGSKNNNNNNNKNQTNGNALDVNECASTIPKIDYEELRDATRNWNVEHVLGKGGFGTVFRGMWKCTAVAIKRIENRVDGDTKMNKIQMQQSLNELRHLNSCRHDNILLLYGYSINGDEPCLVYQLMSGGSLEQRLFKRSANVPALTWKQRVNIAVGTARGLQFLHTFKDNKKPLIHGDIKPANILLDPCNQPKIGDFGLAREGSFGDEAMEVSKVCGTRPYLPEEFIMYHILSVKVDSYSFGIVLFELATGLRAYEKRTYKYLADYIHKQTAQGTLLQLIDPPTKQEGQAEQIFNIIIALGKKCTQKTPAIRLDMVEVLKILEDAFPFATEFYN